MVGIGEDDIILGSTIFANVFSSAGLAVPSGAPLTAAAYFGRGEAATTSATLGVLLGVATDGAVLVEEPVFCEMMEGSDFVSTATSFAAAFDAFSAFGAFPLFAELGRSFCR
jgi:hypothetical protein